MRAKVYVETNKKDIYYYDHVKKAVYDLYPLRVDKILWLSWDNPWFILIVGFRLMSTSDEQNFSDDFFFLRYSR